MPQLAKIRGQERVITRLLRAIDSDHVAHAYLFCGPTACGKTSTALALAAALNCSASPGRGCDDCDSCARIWAGNHPDVRVLERQGARAIIPIDTIREQVIPSLALPPHEGRARVFIVEEATALLGPAANALLKTLEEPPARTHFVLATTSPDQLLPTIRSRCQKVVFTELPPDLRAELSGGSDDLRALEEVADRLFDCSQRAERGGSADAVTAASTDRAALPTILDLLARRLHSEACDAASAGNHRRAAKLANQARMALATTRAVTDHNANAALAVDALLVSMRHNGGPP